MKASRSAPFGTAIIWTRGKNMHFEILVEGQTELTAEQKVIWAKEICPFIDVESNLSPSFQAFRDGIRKLMT
ncbi:hypothetical protein FACS1894187_07630 [Synergistales bacterium]|nr:hypothetical protein FACS1894187_07630 [Synergistales bacterium]